MPIRPPKFKGPGSSVEQQIRQAQREGKFDELPGRGKPIQGLDEVYDPGWWAAKLVKREQVSLLPPELELRRKVEKELARIGKLRRERDVRRALGELNDEIRRTNATVTSGPSTTIAALDVDAIVESWRALQR
ncbi:MAG: DUF1992 domain-containing protein [Deltaproteobacteria bacterium]|nr:DUF1992 domain-containing protein [Deltaproteobacteria bacterium]MBW2413770.1 DUF1992 domain-containing protein [Deltaproteobacteria bacterium]